MKKRRSVLLGSVSRVGFRHRCPHERKKRPDSGEHGVLAGGREVAGGEFPRYSGHHVVKGVGSGRYGGALESLGEYYGRSGSIVG